MYLPSGNQSTELSLLSGVLFLALPTRDPKGDPWSHHAYNNDVRTVRTSIVSPAPELLLFSSVIYCFHMPTAVASSMLDMMM